MDHIRILAVDDHEMVLTAYKYILESYDFESFKVKVDVAGSYEKGEQKIIDSEKTLKYDIILLDIMLFQPQDQEIRSGEDLAVLARKVVPNSKIVFMSSFSDAYRLSSLFKRTNPDGYMIKSEIDEASLIAMVKKVSTKPPYYTAGVLTTLRHQAANSLDVDEKDKQILYFLSIGTKTKDIPPLVNASTAMVESRKRHLKAIFGVSKGNDLALIEEARQRGFI